MDSSREANTGALNPQVRVAVGVGGASEAARKTARESGGRAGTGVRPSPGSGPAQRKPAAKRSGERRPEIH